MFIFTDLLKFHPIIFHKREGTDIQNIKLEEYQYVQDYINMINFHDLATLDVLNGYKTALITKTLLTKRTSFLSKMIHDKVVFV